MGTQSTWGCCDEQRKVNTESGHFKTELEGNSNRQNGRANPLMEECGQQSQSAKRQIHKYNVNISGGLSQGSPSFCHQDLRSRSVENGRKRCDGNSRELSCSIQISGRF